MKYIIHCVLIFAALVLAGCSDNDKDNSTGPSDTKAVFDPLAPDIDADPTAATASALTGWNSLASSHTGRIQRRGNSFGYKSIGVQFNDRSAIYYIADVNKRAAINGFIYRRGGGAKGSQTWTSHGGMFVMRPNNSTATKFRVMRVRR